MQEHIQVEGFQQLASTRAQTITLGLERMLCGIDPDKSVREEAELDLIA
jgi:hypothetical protein